MLNQFSKSFRVFLTAVLAAALCLPAIAQGQSQSSAQTKKSGASVSCDGALDIVPTKSMSFVRKRRPNKTQTPPADSKTQPKPSGEAKSGK